MTAPATIHLHAALRQRATTCRGDDGLTGMLLALRDVGGALHAELTAVWMGGEGLRFMQEHAADLVAGRCVDVQVYRLCPHYIDGRGELRARIAACRVLPKSPSQIKHEEKMQPTTDKSTEKANA